MNNTTTLYTRLQEFHHAIGYGEELYLHQRYDDYDVKKIAGDIIQLLEGNYDYDCLPTSLDENLFSSNDCATIANQIITDLSQKWLILSQLETTLIEHTEGMPLYIHPELKKTDVWYPEYANHDITKLVVAVRDKCRFLENTFRNSS
tara:strand:+ start:2146 stop:2586 length:441 start_codon:yes stop_codon:yes gene_type:complete